MEHPWPALPFLLLILLPVGCDTGVDKDRSRPDPAVGRSFGEDDTTGERNREASHPIRAVRTDSAAVDEEKR